MRALAEGSRDPARTRRLLALSVIAAGGTRSEAAAIGGAGQQTVHNWVVAFSADGPDRLIVGKASGARPRLNAEQRDILEALTAHGSTPFGHGVLRWRLCDLAQILAEDQGVSISEQTPSRGLRAMGCRKFSGRPRHHAQDPDAAAVLKKASPPVCRRSRRLPAVNSQRSGSTTRPVSARRTA